VDAIGRAYTEQLLESGRREVHKIATSLDASTLPTDIRERTPAALAQLEALMQAAAGSVRRGDRGALGAHAAAADALGDTLHVLRLKAGGA
jgi:hypothetical protein